VTSIELPISEGPLPIFRVVSIVSPKSLIANTFCQFESFPTRNLTDSLSRLVPYYLSFAGHSLFLTADHSSLATDGLAVYSLLVAATVCCNGAPEFCILSARQADTREAAARIARNGTTNMLWRACAMIGACTAGI